MSDHTKPRAYELADQLAVSTCKATAPFPREELIGMTSHLRRAAVSIASKIVEGCARHSEFGIHPLSRNRLRFLA